MVAYYGVFVRSGTRAGLRVGLCIMLSITPRKHFYCDFTEGGKYWSMISARKAFKTEEFITSFKRARRNKSDHGTVLAFEKRLFTNIDKTTKEILTGKYDPGKDNQFYVYEPKKRKITSNQFRDKIVQDVLCRCVLEPVIAPTLIYDNYASQPGKGTTMGIERLIHFLHAYYNKYGTNEGYVRQYDIKKYFDSIRIDVLHDFVDHMPIDDILKNLLKLEIRPADEGDEAGICIGHQCSQWLAVAYLNRMDHRIKEDAKMEFYGRYMDDFLMIHPSKEKLNEADTIVKEEIAKVGLRLNEKKSQMYPLKDGIKFLGFHFFLTDTGKVIVKLKKESVKRVKRRLKKFKILVAIGNATMDEIYDSYNSWRAFALNGDTKNIVQEIDKRFYDLFWYEMYEAGIDFSSKCFIPGRMEGVKGEGLTKAHDRKWARQFYRSHDENYVQPRDRNGFIQLKYKNGNPLNDYCFTSSWEDLERDADGFVKLKRRKSA